MPPQSEAQLEKTLMGQLEQLGFLPVVIKDTGVLILNLQNQLEKFNQTTFSEAEFARILNHLNKGLMQRLLV